MSHSPAVRSTDAGFTPPGAPHRSPPRERPAESPSGARAESLAESLAEARSWRLALAIVLGAAALRLALGALLPLVADETYYWEWSRRLAAGYFDHPPAIALLIRGGTLLLGDTRLGVRLLPQLAALVAVLGSLVLARRLGAGERVHHVALVVASLPLAGAMVVATPDAPLLAALTLALLAIDAAVRARRARAARAWWLAAGLGLGLAFASKYTAVLLPFAVLVAFATHPALRRQLARPGPYLGVAVALAVVTPVLLWNSRHEWISFTFQLHHGLGGARGSALLRELAYVGALALLASPVLFVLLAGAVGRALRARLSPEAYLLAVVATVWTGFFALSALRHRVEPNWAAPAFIAAVPLLAAERPSARGARWLRAGFAVGLALVLATYVYVGVISSGLVPGRGPLARIYAWGPVGERVAAERATLGAARAEHAGATWLAGNRYQEASELAFALPDHPPVLALNVASRANQYDLWPRFPERARPGDDLLLVLEDRASARRVIDVLTPSFASIERRESGAAGYQLWVLRAWRGTWPEHAAERGR